MKKYFLHINNLSLHPNFYIYWVSIVFIFLAGYWFPILLTISKIFFFLFISLTLLDYIYLLTFGNIKAIRILPDKFSNGDNNPVKLTIENYYPNPVLLKIIDELPFQFQKRDFKIIMQIFPQEKKEYIYYVKPVKRGIYNFGELNIEVFSPLKLAGYRYRFAQNKNIKVYPSFLQMKKYELIATTRYNGNGLKKIRKIGHTLEFEQIKIYNKGDDFRSINWKATAKKNQLMVNQYQDEQAQNVYSIIDLGRNMKLPFHQMTLLDYAINSTLSFSNIIMKKNDFHGLITFDNNIRHFIKPGNRKSDLHKTFETLYSIDTQYNESDYERLFTFVKKNIHKRSLLMIYTNFEHISSFRRQIIYLRSLAKKHLVLIIIFENVELKKLIHSPIIDTQNLYHKLIAEEFLLQKKLMIKELELLKIQTIFTEPNHLTISTINKYTELKAKSLI